MHSLVRTFLGLVLVAAFLIGPVSWTRAATVTTIARFGGDPDGYHPQAPLIDGGDGFFYGTTEAGGPNNLGTIYKVAPDGTGFATIYLFTGGEDSAHPTTALVAGGDGNFYGVTPGTYPIGNGVSGTIYRVTPAGVLTTIHHFSALDNLYRNADGAFPAAALVRGGDGNLYGTTQRGGTPGAGTIFRVSAGTQG